MQGGQKEFAGTSIFSRCRSPGAFTLVELLVVIGIIAVLIAILMPALSVARQSANRTACASKLHQICVAAQLHASDHQGYYPLAGVLPGYDPVGLDDVYSTKYDYVTIYSQDGLPLTPAPIIVSLARDMSYRNALDDPDVQSMNAKLADPTGLSRNFLCPSQASVADDVVQFPWMFYCIAPNGTLSYWVRESYVFNEAVCGWGAAPDVDNRFRGRVSLIHQAAATMFVADGLMGDPADGRHLDPNGVQATATLYNTIPYPPVTLADAFKGDGNPGDIAGDSESFDLVRHRGKINIGFCDGHVETRDISIKALSNAFLLAP